MLKDEQELVEQIIALAAIVARYQMALEAAALCEYGSDREKIVKKALAKP